MEDIDETSEPAGPISDFWAVAIRVAALVLGVIVVLAALLTPP